MERNLSSPRNHSAATDRVAAQSAPFSPDRVLKLRLVVARFGEMDCACWWNTNGILGRMGKSVLARGFSRTHRFAQARVAFAVASARCKEVFDHPKCITLWKLQPMNEDQVEAAWGQWIDHAKDWDDFFEKLTLPPQTGLLDTLQALGLIGQEQRKRASQLRRSASGQSVLVPSAEHLNDSLIDQLACGFSLGQSKEPVVPYALVEENS
jgi:hypothetical protein